MAVESKISLGPVQYYWSKQSLMDFYAAAADSDVDIIYLGETVCSKRRSLSIKEWIDLARQLRGMGKEVVLSSMVLMESESEISALKSLIRSSDFIIEANDYSAVHLANEVKRPFVAGASLNAYNAQALSVLARMGMVRWHAPVEISQGDLSSIITEMKQHAVLQNVEIEIQGYGRLALSHAARCFSARAANLPKDQCQTLCISHADGITMHSQSDDALFQINGVQVQSYKPCNLMPFKHQIYNMGVDVIRVYGTDISVFPWIDRINANKMPNSSNITLQDQDECNGYWFGQPGMTAFQYDA